MSSSGASSRRSRRSQLDDEVEERMTQIRLKLLEEKLADEKQRAGRSKYRQVVGRDIDDGSGGRIDAEIEVARLRHAELKEQLLREQRLSERLAERSMTAADTGTAAANHRSDKGRGDRFTDMMEMMVMQNSQMHNMILNQMLLRQSLTPQQQQQQPAAAAAAAPQPIYIPMPMYPPAYQQPIERQRSGRDRRTPRTPAAAPAPAPAPQEEKVKKPKKHEHLPFPFPGNESQQKMRRLAYAAFFIASLNRLTNENKFRPTQDFLFDLKLKEILETLHRIYKAPDGQLYSITISTVMGEEADELAELMNVPKTLGREQERAVSQELSYCIENTVFQITDIMPATGILGTHRKSGVFELLRSGNLFPRGYFYDMEREMLEMTEEGRTGQISDYDGQMLIVGMFLVRALIETLYLKTEHYGMVLETTPKAARNIKLVATILFYLYRKIVGHLTALDKGSKKAKVIIPELPPELASSLHSDAEIRPVLKLIKKSLDYAENLMTQWSEEYVNRLRQAAF